MFVAKSYKNLTKLSEPFEKNGKMYITIELKSGLPKDVRAYTAKEYNKMYPEENVKEEGSKTQKEVLGFGKDNFIWVFSGVTPENRSWFAESPCRAARWWGWYLPSEIPLPPNLPSGVRAKAFSADGLFDEEGTLIKEAETAIKKRLKEIGVKVCCILSLES